MNRPRDLGLRIGQRENVPSLQNVAVLEVRQLGAPGDEGVALLRNLADGDPPTGNRICHADLFIIGSDVTGEDSITGGSSPRRQ